MSNQEERAGSRIQPGVLQQRAEDERAAIAVALHALSGNRMELVDRRAVTLANIERLQAVVTEYDAALANLDEEREDLIAMDDALAEEQRALERLLIRRAGR